MGQKEIEPYKYMIWIKIKNSHSRVNSRKLELKSQVTEYLVQAIN